MFHFRTLFILIFLTINTISLNIFAQEGEIILGGEEYITDRSNDSESNRQVNPPMPTKKNIQNKNKDMKKNQKSTDFDLDNFIEKEIDKLVHEMKLKLTLELKLKLKKEIVKFIKDYKKQLSSKDLQRKIKYEIKIRITKVTKTEKKVYRKKSPVRKSKYSSRKKSKWTNVEIVNVKVGKDRQRVEKITDNSPLPISITVRSTPNLKQGKMKVYAKSLETGKSFLIYQIEQFRLNRKWAQDQFVWKGKYVDNGEKMDLESGTYAIICILKIEDKNTKKPRIITRAWGKGYKDYYVTIQSTETTEKKSETK